MKTSFKVKNLIYSIILIPFLFTAVPIQNSLEKTSNSDSSIGAEVLKKEKPTIPKGYSIEQVSMGNKHSAAVVTDGTSDQLYTWGKNDEGQLGLGTGGQDGDYESTPQKVSFPSIVDEETIQIEQISMGGHHSAAVLNTNDGDVLYTWGLNSSGQLGRASSDDSPANEPEVVTFTNNTVKQDIQQIATGENASAAIVNDDNGNHLYTWGKNYDGQLGIGKIDQDPHPEPEEVESSSFSSDGNVIIEEIAMGFGFSSAIVNVKDVDELYTWGNNNKGQLGLGNTTTYSTPQQVEKLPKEDIKEISLGKFYGSVVVNNNEIYTWGENDKEQLGNISSNYYTFPNKIDDFPPDGTNIQQTSLGWKSSATIVDEKLYTWGDNKDGELGTGLTDGQTTSSNPELVSFNLKNTNVKQISMGATSSIAIVNDGKHDYLYTWGSNENGQLGLGNTTSYNTPQQVDLSILVDLSFIDHWYFYFIVVVVPIIVIGLLICLLLYIRKRNIVV